MFSEADFIEILRGMGFDQGTGFDCEVWTNGNRLMSGDAQVWVYFDAPEKVRRDEMYYFLKSDLDVNFEVFYKWFRKTTTKYNEEQDAWAALGDER